MKELWPPEENKVEIHSLKLTVSWEGGGGGGSSS